MSQGDHRLALMGGGIAAMHYIGMRAMRLPAMCDYSPLAVWLSIILAVIIAFAALQMSFIFRSSSGWSWYKAGTALTLGADSVMHYVGMAAVAFVEMPAERVDLSHAVGISDLGILAITAVTLIVLGLVFVTSTLDRRFCIQSRALQSSEQRFRMIVEAALDAFVEIDPNGVITDWNAHAEQAFGWSHLEALGLRIEAIIVLDHDSDGTRALRDLFDSSLADDTSPRARRIEVTARHRSGREFPAEMTLSAIQLNGKTRVRRLHSRCVRAQAGRA